MDNKKLVESLDKPVIMAGGLTVENVAQAIKVVRPFGVDVNTGTKGEDGFRDKEKVRLFTLNSKNA